MSNTVTVYTKPSCVQCVATKRALDKAGIAYDLIDVTEDGAAFDRLVAAGHSQMPVVETADATWAGFNPDRIKALSLTSV